MSALAAEDPDLGDDGSSKSDGSRNEVERANMDIPGYQIDSKIAEGGMAILYKGTQVSLQRPVAIKLLKQHMLENSEVAEYFEAEARIIARLDHPNIIRVIDKGLTKDGMPFFVMNFVEGQDLKDALKSEDLSINDKMNICMQVTRGLSYAHKNGIIHRDIKPGNVLIDQDNNAQVVDFGIAQIANKSEEVDEEATEQAVVGTPAYMAPELSTLGQQASAVTDLYSMGVLMYRVFTGKLPKGDFPPPSRIYRKLPHGLDTLIMRLLAEDPADRPQTADAVAKEMLTIMKGGHLGKTQKAHAEKTMSAKDKFSVLDVIREDQFGSVYLFENAQDHSLMVLKKRLQDSDGFTEGKLLARLKHPNIINVLGANKNDRVFILAMDYVTGGSLHNRLARPMTIKQFLDVAHQIVHGMSFAHRNNIIHGNLRPQNILFSDTDEVKITDFGFQSHYRDDPHKNWYCIAGERKSERADMFAAGVIFHQMLTCNPPQWHGDRIVPSSAFRALPEMLQKLIRKMIAYDPNSRPDSFDDVGHVLDMVEEPQEEQVPKREFRPRQRPQPVKKRKTVSPYLVGLVLVIVVINVVTVMAALGIPLPGFLKDLLP